MRVAIVGAGFGRYGILPAFRLNKYADVIAVCANHKETANKFANEYHIPKAFASWKNLLCEKIDILAIATPPAIQAEITYEALKNNIPVFLEKQIALNIHQSEKLISLATINKVPSCVNFIFPFLNTWRKGYNYLINDEIGQVRHVFLNWRMESYDIAHRTVKTWKTNDVLGGGILQHFLSHSFHYLEYFFGKITKLRCLLHNINDMNWIGNSFASLDLIINTDLVIHIAASNGAYAGTGHSMEIYGSKGSIFLQNETSDPVLGFKLFLNKRNKKTELIDIESNHSILDKCDSRVMPTSYLVNSLIDTLHGIPSSHPTIFDGHRVQLLLHCANIANKEQRLIEIKDCMALPELPC